RRRRDRRCRARGPRRRLTARQVALARPHEDRAPEPEVTNRDDAARDRRQRSVAAVLHAPDRPAHGRRRVEAAGLEAALAVAPELADEGARARLARARMTAGEEEPRDAELRRLAHHEGAAAEVGSP